MKINFMKKHLVKGEVVTEESADIEVSTSEALVLLDKVKDYLKDESLVNAIMKLNGNMATDCFSEDKACERDLFEEEEIEKCSKCFE